MKQTFTVTEKDGVVRVDKHLAYLFPEYSRSALAKLFTLKLIKLNGEPIQPGHKLRPGALVEYDLGPLQAKPEVIDLPVIFENDDIVVVNKPVGIISHARGKFWQEASVASFIRDYVSRKKLDSTSSTTQSDLFSSENVSEEDISSRKPERAGIVHRLDRATSGVMVCAKNSESLSYLQKQFSSRTVTKEYVAVINNTIKLNTAIIDAPIARNTKQPRMFMVDKTGKSAQTKYTVIKQEGPYSTLQLLPKTGRTHQLRVHLSYIGCPIVGDELYDGKEYPRMLLHAHKLTIQLPGGLKKTFIANPPNEFNEIYQETS